MLSPKAYSQDLPRYLYRFRIRHRFANLLPFAVPYSPLKSAHIPLAVEKDFRSTVEVYFQPPGKNIEKGNLLYPYWHVRLVKLADEKGQAFIETLFLFSIAIFFIIALTKIAHQLNQSHHTLVNSRYLAFQAAYQADIYPSSSINQNIQYLPKNNLRSDTLPQDAISQILPVEDKGIAIIKVDNLAKDKNNLRTHTIKRHTALLIGTYAQENHTTPSLSHTLFPTTTPTLPIATVINEIEGHTISPPLINTTSYWQNVLINPD